MFHFNRNQRLELGKAFFNLGNIFAGTVIVNQAISGMLSWGTFIFGFLCFTAFFLLATLLLSNTERN